MLKVNCKIYLGFKQLICTNKNLLPNGTKHNFHVNVELTCVQNLFDLLINEK